MFSLILFILLGAFLLLGLCKPAKGQPLPRGANVPRQEGCSKEISQKYLDSALTYYAEPMARAEGKRRRMDYSFWQVIQLGDMPEGLGPSEYILDGDRNSLDSLNSTLGENDIVVAVPTADADHMGSTLEVDESLHGGLFDRRGGAIALFFGDKALVVTDGLRVPCRDTLWQGALLFIFRGEPTEDESDLEIRLSQHNHDERYSLLGHKHMLVPGESAAVRLSAGRDFSYNRVDLPGAHFEMPAEAWVLRLSIARQLWPFTAVNLRLSGEGEWGKGRNDERVHRVEFDEFEIEFWRFLNIGVADLSVRNILMPDNAYTHRFEGVGPYLGIRIGKDFDLWHTGQFRALLGFDAHGSIGVLWGKAVRPQDLVEQDETATRTNLGLQLRVGVAFFEGGVQ